jgi:transcriptional regulator with XRE-family HTH domain
MTCAMRRDSLFEPTTFGDALAKARSRTRLSQLELAVRAGTTQRHVSFLERGRSVPGKGLVIRLAEALELSLRERNALLLRAGYAPVYEETPLSDPSLRSLREAMQKILIAHDPFPALMTDQAGTLLAGNEALNVLLEGVDASLLVPPVNVRRVALHPRGLAPRVLNFAQWGRHVVEMIHRDVSRRPDPAQSELLIELEGYVDNAPVQQRPDYMGLAMPLHLASSAGNLTLLTTVTSFSTAVDITIAELRLEAFLPADADTAARLESLREMRRSSGPSDSPASRKTPTETLVTGGPPGSGAPQH